jgi:hypothetical protein
VGAMPAMGTPILFLVDDEPAVLAAMAAALGC